MKHQQMTTTHAEVTAGTNAAMPIAQADINQMAGSFASDIPLGSIQKIVADVVAAAIPAVDAYRAANPLITSRRLTMLAGWRTLLVGVAVAVAGVLQTFNWATVVPQNQTWSGVAMLLIGGVIVFLRYITTTPIGVPPGSAGEK